MAEKTETPKDDSKAAAPSDENLNCESQKPSIDILKESKPSPNISIVETNSCSIPEKPSETPSSATKSKKQPETTPSATVEGDSSTAPEKSKKEAETPTKDEEVSKLTAPKTEGEVNKDVAKPITAKESQNTSKTKSDIFSLQSKDTITSTIFSVGGIPSKTIHQTDSANTNSCTSSDTIATQGSRHNNMRNPLTGYGVSSNDEYKNKPSRRKDGNPVLGVGYKDNDDVFTTPPPNHRVPPGGYSQGLW